MRPVGGVFCLAVAASKLLSPGRQSRACASVKSPVMDAECATRAACVRAGLLLSTIVDVQNAHDGKFDCTPTRTRARRFRFFRFLGTTVPSPTTARYADSAYLELRRTSSPKLAPKLSHRGLVTQPHKCATPPTSKPSQASPLTGPGCHEIGQHPHFGALPAAGSPHLVGRPVPPTPHFGTVHRVGPIRNDASLSCAWLKVAMVIMAWGASA